MFSHGFSHNDAGTHTVRLGSFNSPAGINKDNELFPQDGVTDCQMDLPE